MAPNILHLPNGASVSVTSVYGGLYFKSNELATPHALPPGWTIILHSEDDMPESIHEDDRAHETHTHRYRRPTLRNDALFISSISLPSNYEFKPAASPTRQVAMMLWTSLWWYYHQPRPGPQITTSASSNTPEAGKPKNDWRIRIKRAGVFTAPHMLSKLERMGLIASEDSSVGTDNDRSKTSFQDMFVTQRSFWQIDARVFLFTLSPANGSPFPSGTPSNSRPSSPSRSPGQSSPRPDGIASAGLWSPGTPGPFTSSSHLPTYFPPPPPQYVFTKGIRHPLRPKPPRQGETFYTRYVPSVGQYLSFRVASLSEKCVAYSGPVGTQSSPGFLPPMLGVNSNSMARALNGMNMGPCDMDLLHTWMNDERVAKFWGVRGPWSVQEEFLRNALRSRNSFPVIGCWDGKPFGYFEIYWVKEDTLGPHVDEGQPGDWSRGFHALVGEQEFRGPHRVKLWMSALVHHCLLADLRTTSVLCEPRVDNEKFISYLQDVGFQKQREVSLPHKQSALMKILREAWDCPFL